MGQVETNSSNWIDCRFVPITDVSVSMEISTTDITMRRPKARRRECPCFGLFFIYEKQSAEEDSALFFSKTKKTFRQSRL